MLQMVDLSSIRENIKSLIKALNEVTNHQEEFHLITKRLTNIIKIVNTEKSSIDEQKMKVVLSNLEITVNALRMCIEEEASTHEKSLTNNVQKPKIDQRQIQNVLLNALWRLSSYESDLANDPESRRKLLTEGFFEQQMLRKKLLEEYIRLRSQAAKIDAIKNSQELLQQLRHEHGPVITDYLGQCLSLHGTISVTGLEAAVVSEVARRFYGISLDQQEQLEQSWRPFQMPLEYCPIQLRADQSTSLERKAARHMLMGDKFDPFFDFKNRVLEQRETWTNRLLNAPYMPSMVKRDRFILEDDEKSFEINEVLRENRWIVILGDPGSGKTTFVRWLMLQYIQALNNGENEFDFGPVRMPILIRIGEFADALRENPTLTLFDHIGHHKWLGNSILSPNMINISAIKQLSKALQDYIRKGQALIILDGLDEISASEQRNHLVNLVEKFVDVHVQTPSFESAFDDSHVVSLIDTPDQPGGNQLLITSRIVGYHAAPITGQFSHFIIKPMNVDHMEEFINFWFRSVHTEIIRLLTLIDPQLEVDDETWRWHAYTLKTELNDEENVGLRELVSNAFLMTFICGIAFRSEEKSLPKQRILLYSQTVDSMISAWESKGSDINENKLVCILGDIAEYIHQNSSSGLIDEDDLKRICSSSIRSYVGMRFPTDDDLKRFDDEAMQFVQIIRNDVGILAARGESMYGFLHLTFQEYFTSLSLTDKNKLKHKPNPSKFTDIQLLAQSLHAHINDPRFRIVLILAFGKLSLSKVETYLDDVCSAFLMESQASNSFLPLAPLLLISCGNDLCRPLSSNVLFDSLDQLLVASARDHWYQTSPQIFSQLVDSMKKLQNSSVTAWIHRVLSQTVTQKRETVQALCHLIQHKTENSVNFDWLDLSVCRLLFDLSHVEDKRNDFSIDTLLAKITLEDHRFLPAPSNSLRFFLEQKEIDINNIHPSILALLIAVYGGLKRQDKTIVFDPKHIHRDSSFLTPLLKDYFADRKTPQVEKLRRLEKKCHGMLSMVSSSDESSNAVDAMIAILCVFGIEKLWTHPHLFKSKILSSTLARFKHVSFILRQCYAKANADDAGLILTEYMKTRSLLDLECVNEKKSKEFLQLVHAIKRGLARLQSFTKESIKFDGKKSDYSLTFRLPHTLKIEESLQHLLSLDITLSPEQQSCSYLSEFVSLFWILEDDEETDTQYRMAVAADMIPTFLTFNNNKDPMYALAFVPEHLRLLFIRLLQQHEIVTDGKEFPPNILPFQHILIECLMTLLNSSCKQLSLTFTLCALLPLLRVYQLENLAAHLSWALSLKDEDLLHLFEFNRQRPMNPDTNQYTDGLTEFSDLPADFLTPTRQEIISRSQKQEQTRLQAALARIHHSSRYEKANIDLYSASISLAYICWFSHDVDPASLLREAIDAASSIQLPLLRFDALCVISLHPHAQSDSILLNNKRSLRDELDQRLIEIGANLTPLLHTTILIRCFPVLGKSRGMEKFIQDLLTKLNSEDTHVSHSDQQAIYAALFEISYENQLIYSYLYKLMEKANHTCAHESELFLSFRSRVFSSYFTESTSFQLSSSMVSLLCAMYLTELTSDCHRLTTWLTLNLKKDSDDLYQNGKEYTLNVHDTVVLTCVQAQSVERTFHSHISHEREMKSLIKLSNSLHSILSVDTTAWPIVVQWLAFEHHPQLQLLSWHAALLLLESNRWTAKATMIVSNLLCSQHDRFRQRADKLMTILGDKQIQTSTQLGLETVLALIDRYSWSCHNSSYAEIALLRKLYRTSIDQVHHLEIILQLEQYRIVKMNSGVQDNISIDHPELSNALKIVMTSGYSDVPVFDTFQRLSPEMFSHMAALLRSDFSTLPKIHTSSQRMSDEDHQTFVVNVLIALGITLSDKSLDATILVDAITEIVNRTSSRRIQQGAVYALGFSKLGRKPLLNVIQSANKLRNGKEVEYPEEVLCTTIRAYCYYVSDFEEDFDNEDNMNVFLQLLEHPSPNIAKVTHQGLGRAIDDTDRLLELLKFDQVECYRALLIATADIFITGTLKKCISATADFIKEHSDLLPIFVFDLYESIRHFSDELFYDGSTLHKYEYGYPHYVPVAAALVEHMPTAFCTYVNECGYGDELKRALYYTSKQRDTFRRSACLTVLSAFGELTVDLCEMLVQALLDDPHVQNTCYRCLARIQSVKDEQVINKLLEYLNSDSMNTRYAVSKLLIRLTQSAIIPLMKIQEALIKIINDPTSNEELWLIVEQKDMAARSIYYNVGKLRDAVYNLLVKHLVSDTSNETPLYTVTSHSADLTEEDTDFIASEKAARLAACLFEEEEKENEDERISTRHDDVQDIATEQILRKSSLVKSPLKETHGGNSVTNTNGIAINGSTCCTVL